MSNENTIAPLRDIKLLIADNNAETLEMLAYKAQLMGWKAITVASASGIISAMNQSVQEGPEFDAIIADVNFFDNQPGPRLTGITAVREIRKVRPDIPIIFITAYSNSIMREEIRRVRAELMQKPFDINLLFGRTAQLVAWYRDAKLHQNYQGVERRSRSVNMSGHQRRSTDINISPNPIVSGVLAKLRDEATTQ